MADYETVETPLAAEPGGAPETGYVARAAAWVSSAVLLLFLVFAALAAIGNMIGMAGIAASLNTSVSTVGWFWLAMPLLAPVLLGTLALWPWPNRRAPRWLLLLLAVTLVAVLQIETQYLIPQGFYLNAV